MRALLNFFVFFLVVTYGWVARADETFDVGVAIPLSGVAADYGLAIKNCFELAQKDRPELFTNIRFLYEDTIYDPKVAVTSFNRLVDVNKIDLAITWGVAACKVLAPIAESREMPLMGLCIDPTTAANRKWVLRFMNVTYEFMTAMTEYLEHHHQNKLGIIMSDYPYLEEMAEALRRGLRPGQTMTIVDRLPTDAQDFRTHIIKLARSDYDAIGVFLFAGQVSTFFKQARELGFTKPTFGTNLFESLSEIRASNGAMEGGVFTSLDIKEPFLKRYRALFKNESQLAFGAPGYELALTIGELFNKRAGSISSSEIISAFANVPPREGISSGPYHYVNDPEIGQYFKFPIVAKKIVGENLEVVE